MVHLIIDEVIRKHIWEQAEILVLYFMWTRSSRFLFPFHYQLTQSTKPYLCQFLAETNQFKKCFHFGLPLYKTTWYSPQLFLGIVKYLVDIVYLFICIYLWRRSLWFKKKDLMCLPFKNRTWYWLSVYVKWSVYVICRTIILSIKNGYLLL